VAVVTSTSFATLTLTCVGAVVSGILNDSDWLIACLDPGRVPFQLATAFDLSPYL